jgi:hypothetical protein
VVHLGLVYHNVHSETTRELHSGEEQIDAKGMRSGGKESLLHVSMNDQGAKRQNNRLEPGFEPGTSRNWNSGSDPKRESYH